MTPIPAATVLLLRDGDDGIEVLMGLRKTSATFGGFWAFPGGVVEEADSDPYLTGLASADGPWRSAALRETAEEIGVFFTDPQLDDPPFGLKGRELLTAVAAAGARFATERLVYMSNWVTPTQAPRRFDTRFFAVPFDGGEIHPVSELAEVRWVSPAGAIAEHESGGLALMLPTLSQLRMLLPHRTAAEFLASVDSSSPVPTIQPRVVETEDGFVFLIPGDDGYEQ